MTKGNVDWRKILILYIRHVKKAEGIDFILDADGDYEGPIDGMTAQEIDALAALVRKT